MKSLPAGKPVVVDLCSGRGGWVEGFRRRGWFTVALDIVRFKDNRANRFIRSDVRSVDGTDYRGLIHLVVASPPCTEFSRHDQASKRAKIPYDLSSWIAEYHTSLLPVHAGSVVCQVGAR